MRQLLGLLLVAPRLAAASTIATAVRARHFTSPRLETLENAQRSAVIRIPGFLDDETIEALHATAACVSAEAEGEQDIHRRQGCKEGSWLTVFINHRLATLMPTLHDRLFAAAQEADADNWQLLDPERNELNMRVVEYHAVLPGGGIPMDKHHDFGSLFTLDVMLSTPGDDFEGGRFQTLEPDGTLQTHSFEKGDLMIFQSHKYHCVQPVTSGERRVLVCEIWEGLPRRCARRCRTPWGPCECAFAPEPALYVTPRKEDLTPLKPCLRLMAKSDEELATMLDALPADGEHGAGGDAAVGSGGAKAAVDERTTVGAHALWKRRQALDKQLKLARGE